MVTLKYQIHPRWIRSKAWHLQGRWRRHLDPGIKRDAWKAREDSALMALYDQFGSQWSSISKAIPGRTAQQCRAR